MSLPLFFGRREWVYDKCACESQVFFFVDRKTANPRNIPIAANPKPKWKLTFIPIVPTINGARKPPRLIPI